MQRYPLNAWYVGAWAHEIATGSLTRTICGEEICIARHDATRAAVAHAAASQRPYPAIERHRFIWLWMGAPDLADLARVPDLHWNDDPDWVGEGDVIHAACDYRLLVDNLMDLTHETFVHESSIGNLAVAEAPFDVTHGDHTATVTRWIMNAQAAPWWGKQLKDSKGLSEVGLVDRWQIIRFEAPSAIAIDVGVAPSNAGAREGNRQCGINHVVINALTPETDTRCHYFWSNVRNYALDDHVMTDNIRRAVASIFKEDEAIVEAQQRAIEDNPGHTFYNLNIDAGALWARRLIDQSVAAEARVQERPAVMAQEG